ncbi:hypothetical protein JCM33374_g6079 [Metschnikowia sp. JCM 33374]|nr:hypothetical protein JCM33374_g6079 [Metschnikowia sp. JCM 33374]
MKLTNLFQTVCAISSFASATPTGRLPGANDVASGDQAGASITPGSTQQCLFDNVHFFMPASLETLRAPVSVAIEARIIYWTIVRKSEDIHVSNTRLQSLLFERLLLRGGIDDENLPAADRAFKEAYVELYRAAGAPCNISVARKQKFDDLIDELLTLRGSFLAILYGEHVHHTKEEVEELVSDLNEDITSLALPICTIIPEERLLIDISRGLRVISDAVVRKYRTRNV